MTSPSKARMADRILPILHQARTRLVHPVNFGRHGLTVTVATTRDGLGADLVVSDHSGMEHRLVRVHRDRGLYVTRTGTMSMDVRARACFDAIGPELRTLDHLLADGYVPGGWAPLR